MNPYDILGLPASASLEEITSRYKSLAQKHHPDKGGDEEVFKQIKLAYEILSDPGRRLKYDSTGEVEEDIPLMQEALDQICRIFLGILPSCVPEHDNIITKLKAELHNIKNQVIAELRQTSEYIVKLEKIIARIKRKKQGENLMKVFVEAQLKNSQKSLSLTNHKLVLIELMLNIAEEYEYGTDEELIQKLTQSVPDDVA